MPQTPGRFSLQKCACTARCSLLSDDAIARDRPAKAKEETRNVKPVCTEYPTFIPGRNADVNLDVTWMRSVVQGWG